ncbi:YhcH/YjgK/YiaL family protein (plasmid) [Paenibacillus cellulosilyticus]|uniref:YhcH/YjgK/YiaL family protein n=1 Tax=Paenibacillus cellulosilyticus TaxID=375489 RepID=UPI0015811DE1|nr:YhcH/YjgK/YiaL family protein [Paenibacillus cellulosilyticus]QKS47932.1 YhcH/YjgK/YiaL family protein [Paenibacillus cellulosilyticus]
MIFDKLDNLSNYLPKPLYAQISKCLENINADSVDAKFDIDGENVFLRVMSYNTSLRENCAIEAHNQYIDIQSVLVGSEGIDIFERDRLKVKDEYSLDKDVVFFKTEDACPITRVSVDPGYFALIFPHEAHKPQVAVGDVPQAIKKFVIKVKLGVYEQL